MNIKFMGTGPADIVEGRGKNRRTNTSAMIFFDDSNILINTSKFFEEHAKKYNIKKIDAILISHGHRDCIGGLYDLKQVLEPDEPIPIYCEKRTWNRIKDDFKELDHLKFHEIKPYNPFKIHEKEITPFRVKHSRNPNRFPTVGFHFNKKLTWCEDCVGVPEKSEKFFDNVSIVVLDAAMWFGDQIFNHFNIEDSMQFMKDKNAKKLYLIQLGRTYPDFGEAKKAAKKRWKELDGKADLYLTYDGMTVNLKTLQVYDGIYLIKPFGEEFAKDKLSGFVKSTNYDIVQKPLYLASGKKAYGVIYITNKQPINHEKFVKLKDKHKISTFMKKIWWANIDPLYFYEFKTLKKFKKPIEYETGKGVKHIIKNMELKKYVDKEVHELRQIK